MTKPKTREGLREYYRGDFYGFLEDVLVFDKIREQPHRELCDFLQYGKGDGSSRTSNIPGILDDEHFIPRAGSDVSRKIVLLPRGSFKTSYITVGYTMWRLCNNPKMTVLLFSWNFDIMMARMVRQLKSMFRKPNVMWLYGDPDRNIYLDDTRLQGKGFTNKIWNASQMQLWDIENNRPLPFDRLMTSIQAAGAEESCEGLHPDLLIVDDIVTRKNSQSPKLREKVKHISALLEPLVPNGGEFIYVGTRYHYDDLYGKLIQNKFYDVLLRSAYNDDGSLYFPGELTEAYLDEKRHDDNMGVYDFSCQYLNQPVSPADAKFEAEWLNMAASHKFPAGSDKVPKWSFWDPSTGAKRGDDFAVVCGYRDEGIAWITTASRFHKKDTSAIDMGLTLCRDDNVTDIWIEVNSNQVYFVNLLKQILKTEMKWKSYQPKIHAYYQNTADKNKQARIMNLVPKLQNGTVRFRPEHKALYHQLLQFPHGKDDLPDALEGLVRLLKPSRKKVEKSMEEMVEEWRQSQEVDVIRPKKSMSERNRLFRNVYMGGAM